MHVLMSVPIKPGITLLRTIVYLQPTARAKEIIKSARCVTRGCRLLRTVTERGLKCLHSAMARPDPVLLWTGVIQTEETKLLLPVEIHVFSSGYKQLTNFLV